MFLDLASSSQIETALYHRHDSVPELEIGEGHARRTSLLQTACCRVDLCGERRRHDLAIIVYSHNILDHTDICLDETAGLQEAMDLG